MKSGFFESNRYRALPISNHHQLPCQSGDSLYVVTYRPYTIGAGIRKLGCMCSGNGIKWYKEFLYVAKRHIT